MWFWLFPSRLLLRKLLLRLPLNRLRPRKWKLPHLLRLPNLLRLPLRKRLPLPLNPLQLRPLLKLPLLLLRRPVVHT